MHEEANSPETRASSADPTGPTPGRAGEAVAGIPPFGWLRHGSDWSRSAPTAGAPETAGRSGRSAGWP